MRGHVRQLIESIIDVGSGLIIATLLQLFVFPLFGMYPTVWESFNIAVIFMCVSIFRSWLWRLVFVRFKKKPSLDKTWKLAEQIVRRQYSDEDVKIAYHLQNKYGTLSPIAKDKRKETTQKEWLKGYWEWKNKECPHN